MTTIIKALLDTDKHGIQAHHMFDIQLSRWPNSRWHRLPVWHTWDRLNSVLS